MLRYDAGGNVVAHQRMIMKPPWHVYESQKYSGSFFFFNDETRKKSWILDPETFDQYFEKSSLSESTDDESDETEVESTKFLPSISPLVNSFGKSSINERNSTSNSFTTFAGHLSSLPVSNIGCSFNTSLITQRTRSTPATSSCAASSFDGISGLNRLFPSVSIKEPSQTQDVYPEHLVKIPRRSSSRRSLSIVDAETASGITSIQSSLSSISPSSFSPISAVPSGGNWDDWCEPSKACLFTRNFPLQQRGQPCLEVVGGLGCGGCAVVVEVEHIYSRKKYALKVVEKVKEEDRNNKKAVETELVVLSASEKSAFLQTCLFAFENSTNVYMLMELYSGGDLFNYLSHFSNGLPESQCVTILAELYLGLEHLHNYHFIHRDIKIENVMFDPNGHIKLIDFGFAKKITKPVEMMKPVGSLLYMAPELIMNSEGGRHTDWWAYGILAFELLTGSTPWSDISDEDKIKQEIQTMVFTPTPSSCDKKIMSYDAWKLVESLLNRKVSARLGSRSDVEVKECSFFKHVDWQSVLDARSPPVYSPSSAQATQAFVKKDRAAALDKYLQHVTNLKHDDCGFIDRMHTWSSKSISAEYSHYTSFNSMDVDMSDNMFKMDEVSEDVMWELGLQKASTYLIF